MRSTHKYIIGLDCNHEPDHVHYTHRYPKETYIQNLLERHDANCACVMQLEDKQILRIQHRLHNSIAISAL